MIRSNAVPPAMMAQATKGQSFHDRPASDDAVSAEIKQPWSVLAVVAMWSALEVGSFWAYATANPGGGEERDAVLSLLFGGIASGVLFSATWWILGARPNPKVETAGNSDRNAMLIDRSFRLILLTIALMCLVVTANAIREGISVIGHTMVAVPIVLLFPIMYRQTTGRRIARYRHQERAAFDIRGLMLVTFAMAIAGAVASVSGVFQTETFLVAILYGASFGMVWFAMTGMLMHRPYSWTLASVLLIGIHVAVIVGIGILGPSDPDKTLMVLGPLTAGLYFQGLMYWGVARSADFRLG